MYSGMTFDASNYVEYRPSTQNDAAILEALAKCAEYDRVRRDGHITTVKLYSSSGVYCVAHVESIIEASHAVTMSVEL